MGAMIPTDSQRAVSPPNHRAPCIGDPSGPPLLRQTSHPGLQSRCLHDQLTRPQDLPKQRILIRGLLEPSKLKVPILVDEQLDEIRVQLPQIPGCAMAIHHDRCPVEINRREPNTSQIIESRPRWSPLRRLRPFPEPIPQRLCSYNEIRAVRLDGCTTHPGIHQCQ